MARFDESIDVNASVSEAYNLFSQFERFPGFMEGVEEVTRTGENKLHWKAEVAGREEEWDALITREEADTAIAWQSVSGSRNVGEVTFEKLDQDTTQINLHIEYEPEGFVENVGSFLGVVNGRMRGDLKRFKELVESDEHASGWHDPVDRSSAAADRDRQVGEARRSLHRDDVGYKSRMEDGAAGISMDRAGNTVDRAGENAERAAERTAESVSDAADRTLERGRDAADRLEQRGRDLADQTGDRLERGRDEADRLERGRHHIADAADDLEGGERVEPRTERDRRDI